MHPPRLRKHVSIVLALMIALGGALAGATRPASWSGLISPSIWIETLRPLCIALALLALTTALALAYGEESSKNGDR